MAEDRPSPKRVLLTAIRRGGGVPRDEEAMAACRGVVTVETATAARPVRDAELALAVVMDPSAEWDLVVGNSCLIVVGAGLARVYSRYTVSAARLTKRTLQFLADGDLFTLTTGHDRDLDECWIALVGEHRY